MHAAVRLRPVAPLLVPALLALAGCATGPSRSVDLLGPEALCAEGSDALRCGQTIEAVQLETFGSQVRREEGTLSLRIGEREGLSFPDSPPGTRRDEARRFTFRDYLPATGFYLLGEHFAAGTSWLLVHAGTGATYRVDGLPLFSPDGAHALVLPLGAEGRVTAIQLWRVDGDRVAMTWAHTPPVAEAAEWSVGQPVWTDARTVRLVQSVTDPGGTRFREEPLLLRHGPAGWTLTAAAP